MTVDHVHNHPSRQLQTNTRPMARVGVVGVPQRSHPRSIESYGVKTDLASVLVGNDDAVADNLLASTEAERRWFR